MARPRKKEASLTIRDLGGDPQAGYTPSGDVIEALESFRAEVASTQGLGQSAVFGDSGLPELDARSRDLFSFATGAGPTEHAPSQPAKGPQRDMRGLLIGIWIAAGVLAIILIAFQFFQSAPEPATVAVTYHNRAPDMMKQNAPGLEVLKAAIEAIKNDPSEANQRVADEARNYFGEQIQGLLNAPAWQRETIEQASRLTIEATAIDSTQRIRDLRQEVLDEVNAYNMFLSVDATNETVTYRKTASDSPVETVGVGDLMAGRFEVLRITPRQVHLEDQKRQGPGGGRRLIYWVDNGNLTPMN